MRRKEGDFRTNFLSAHFRGARAIRTARHFGTRSPLRIIPHKTTPYHYSPRALGGASLRLWLRADSLGLSDGRRLLRGATKAARVTLSHRQQPSLKAGRVSGLPTATFTDAATPQLTGPTSGMTAVSNANFEGDIAEVMFFDSALSQSETDKVFCYLNTKYNLSSTRKVCES